MRVKECPICVQYINENKDLLVGAWSLAAAMTFGTFKNIALSYISAYHNVGHDRLALAREYVDNFDNINPN